MTNIFDQVTSLDLPPGEYAVTGSGVLAAHGIREYKDIDLLVTLELYEGLKRRGWVEREIKSDLTVIENGLFEASPGIMTLPTYRPDIAELISEADIIQGVAFVRLEEVAAFKKALGREKDLADIRLIEAYLTARKLKNAPR